MVDKCYTQSSSSVVHSMANYHAVRSPPVPPPLLWLCMGSGSLCVSLGPGTRWSLRATCSVCARQHSSILQHYLIIHLCMGLIGTLWPPLTVGLHVKLVQSLKGQTQRTLNLNLNLDHCLCVCVCVCVCLCVRVYVCVCVCAAPILTLLRVRPPLKMRSISLHV